MHELPNKAAMPATYHVRDALLQRRQRLLHVV
jgi:hypothetical protein